MDNSNTPSTSPDSSAEEKQEQKPEQETKESAPQAATEEAKPPAPTPEADAEKESSLDDVLAPAETARPKPVDFTPPKEPVQAAPADGAGAPPPKPPEERYEMPKPLGEKIVDWLKALGLGKQIGLGGAVLCLMSSLFWAWEKTDSNRAAWFAILVVLILSLEAVALILLEIPERFASWREKLRLGIYVLAGHIILLSILALLLGAKVGPVLSLLGGVAVCAGNYIALVKSPPKTEGA